MSAHARTAPAGQVAATTTTAAFATLVEVLAAGRRVFLLAGIFCFTLALTTIALQGVGLRTIDLRYSHSVDAPANPVPTADADSPSPQ
jgi:hypothetical protein